MAGRRKTGGVLFTAVAAALLAGCQPIARPATPAALIAEPVPAAEPGWAGAALADDRDRIDRLAQVAQSQTKSERLGRRRSDRKVCAPPPQAPSHPA